MATDLYAVLGVARDATQEEVRTRYRELARKLHPDAAPGDDAAEARFKEVGSAYEVLSDPERRALYDRFGEASLQPGFDAEAAERYSGGFPFGDAGTQDFGGFEDLISQLFRERAPRPTRGADLETGLEVDFDTALRGGSRLLTLKRAQGDGQLQEERLRVEIPAGADSGTRLRLAGKGSPGPAGPGDLYVALRVRPHRLFSRRGRDLDLDVPVHYREAVLGAEISVPTLDGRARLRVPPGSRDGSRLRLRGKGVPAAGAQAAGDLYVTLRVHVPSAPGPDERQALESLASFEDPDLRRDLLR